MHHTLTIRIYWIFELLHYVHVACAFLLCFGFFFINRCCLVALNVFISCFYIWLIELSARQVVAFFFSLCFSSFCVSDFIWNCLVGCWFRHCDSRAPRWMGRRQKYEIHISKYDPIEINCHSIGDRNAFDQLMTSDDKRDVNANCGHKKQRNRGQEMDGVRVRCDIFENSRVLMLQKKQHKNNLNVCFHFD